MGEFLINECVKKYCNFVLNIQLLMLTKKNHFNFRPTNQSLSMGETSTLIAMREKIDERLRNSESEPRLLAPNNPMPLAFMNQLQLWNILQMMNPG